MMKRTIVLSVFALVISACGASPDTATDPISTTSSSTAAVAAVQSTTEPPATTEPPPAVPWLEPPLAAGSVPDALTSQWLAADNRDWCSALFPADAEQLGAGASIRPAVFGGGWAVAWDLPDGPGRLASGEYCSDCGRGAYGVAGSGVYVFGDEAARWPTVLAFDDGSIAGYGYEGDADPDSGAPVLTYLLVKGEGCSYNVWSFLGEEHLLQLLYQLRRVEGLEGEPTLWQSELPVPDTVALGLPPWDEQPLGAEAVAEVAYEEWAESGSRDSCPMLFIADLGDADGATARRAANEGEMLVAWDLPDGPGHNGDSSPCDDCGRGVIGLGTFPRNSFDGPVAYTWSDGSEARIRTGPYSYGTEAFVRVAGFDCDYWMWSHLGQEHLEYLFSQLRRVDGSP